MKKGIFLMLALMVLSVASMNAQVRIGGDTNPNPAAVLDLNATDDATPSGNKGGLSLPRVALTSVSQQLNNATPQPGTLVYNTGTGLNGAGTYVWTTQWTKVSEGASAPVITTQPAKFSFKRLKDTDGDPNGPAVAGTTLTVVAKNATGYQWYKKAINVNAPDTLISGATSASYTFTPAAADVANWGLYQFYCVVSNTSGSVTSDLAEVALGCGAKTVTGGWLKFMCYNLGATTTGDPFTWNDNILGNFYQWGRPDPADRTNTTTNFTITTAFPYDWKIPAGYATPISEDYHQNDLAWQSYPAGGTITCPGMWHVPAQSAFEAIVGGRGGYEVGGRATANTWTRQGDASNIAGEGGYDVQPDGSVTTLYFPNTGFRRIGDGSVALLDFGYYWTASPHGSAADCLTLTPDGIRIPGAETRGLGAALRCTY